MITLDFLEKVAVFKDFNDEQLKAIQICATEADFKRGDKLFGEGENSTHLWIVADGQVDLTFELSNEQGTENTISFISENEVFGWTCFVPPYRYRLSGYCVTRSCRVVKIEKECLQQLFDKDPQIGYNMMAHLIRAIGSQFHQFQDEYAKTRGQNIMSGW